MEKQKILLDVVRQNYASVVWTHKTHEKQAEIYAKEYKCLETINIIVAALTSCGIITICFYTNIIAQVLTAVASFITLGITAYFKSFDLRTLEVRNKAAANQFIGIRNELLNVIANIKYEKNELDENKAIYEGIMERLNKLYVDAPATTQKACDMASESLKVKKDYTFTDEEIDMFLPKSLRNK
ncbi:MAG: SLATT domain-containing protein [Lachnospiraceae bacterium]|nr:SLATT domain-containing protein [Candidatus Colinaster equi]